MGWWEDTENPEVVLGDEPFDLARRLLAETSRAYREGTGRKPTLGEFLRNVEDALRTSAHDYLSDCGDVEVGKLSAKTAKRKKRQEFEVGDLFSFPLPDGTSTYGRILLKDSMGYLVSILDVVGDAFRRPGELAGAPELLSLYVTPVAWENWQWRILGGHEEYSTDGLVHPCFKMGNDNVGWRKRCGPEERPATASEVANLEQLELWPPVRVEWRVAAERGLVGVEDVQRMLAKGHELAAAGEHTDAATEFGMAMQYAQWVRGNVSTELLREQALQGLRASLEKQGQ